MAHHRKGATRGQMAFRVILALAVASASGLVVREALTTDVYTSSVVEPWSEPTPLSAAPPEPLGTAVAPPLPAPAPDAAEGESEPSETDGAASEENGSGDPVGGSAVGSAADAAEEAAEAAQLAAVQAQARGDTGGNPEPLYSADDDAEAQANNRKGDDSAMSDVAGMKMTGTAEMEAVANAPPPCSPRK